MEEEIDLMDMIKYFWSKKVWIILVGIICVVLAVFYTKYLITPEYTASAAFILTNDNLKTEADVYSYAKLPDRYFAITNSRAVLDKVIANLKLDGFENIETIESFQENNIEITHSPVNFMIRATVTTDNAKEAADIANEIIKVAMEEIKLIYKDENIQILDYAKENWEPVNIEMISTIVKFVLVGEVLICGYILVFYMLVEGMKKETLKELEEKERISKEYEIKEKEVLTEIKKTKECLDLVKLRKELKKDEYKKISKINDEILKCYAKEAYVIGYIDAVKNEKK